MILHLVVDDKFIDDGRALFEEVAPGNHRWFVIREDGGSTPLQYIRSFQPEVISELEFLEVLRRNSTGVDGLILHFLDDRARSVLRQCPPRIPVVWIGWGYDYYHLIRTPNSLLGPRTTELLAQMAVPPLGFRERLNRLAENPIQVIADRVRRTRRARLGPGGKAERRLLSRVDYFVPVILKEAELIRNRNPWFHPDCVSWNYPYVKPFKLVDEGFTLSGDDILLGNSATPTNNHLDWLHSVYAEFPSNRRIICPLTYGNARYRALVTSHGARLFGERFVPLSTYVPQVEYLALLRTCRTVVMPHKRQQALGNILTMIYAGAQVFLDRENPLYEFLTELGLPVRPLDTFRTDSCEAHDDVAGARAILLRVFGHQANLVRTAKLIEALGRR